MWYQTGKDTIRKIGSTKHGRVLNLRTETLRLMTLRSTLHRSWPELHLAPATRTIISSQDDI